MTCKDCAEPHGMIEKAFNWLKRYSLVKKMDGKDKSWHRWVIKHSAVQPGLSKKKRKALMARRYEMDKEKANRNG